MEEYSSTNTSTILKKNYFTKDPVHSLEFELSENQTINANKYSFYNVFADKRIDYASFEDRMEMLNSWIEDLSYNYHNLYRRPLQTGCQPLIEVHDPADNSIRRMVNMASNDYLNLSQHPDVIEAAVRSMVDYGAGPGGAPLLSGTTNVLLQLEEKLAAMKQCEDALVFTSGYTANVGVISTLMRSCDLVIYDMYAHASLLDGGTNTNKKFFKHNDIASLENILVQTKDKYVNKLVVVDGVYSMDGDIAPLDKIVEIAHQYGAWVLVDEAHATGVIGEKGGGTVEHFNLKNKVDVVTGTLSKAIGSTGGFVAGSKELINYIKYSSRPYMFSTAPFVPACAAALKAIQIIEEDMNLRAQLWRNIRYIREELLGMGFNIGSAQTAIFPLIIGDDYKVKQMAYLLHEEDIFVNSVPYPAVPRKITRVRLSVTAGHTERHLCKTVDAVRKTGKQLGII